MHAKLGYLNRFEDSLHCMVTKSSTILLTRKRNKVVDKKTETQAMRKRY